MSLAYAPPVQGPTYPQGRLQHVVNRALYLQRANEPHRADMARIRAIMDGGAEGMVALLGAQLADFDEEDRAAIPAANFILSGTEHAAHRLGQRPDLRCDPPAETEKKAPREAAEKRERIVEAYDEQCEMEMLLPQLARWLIGYGYVPMIVTDTWDADGYGYPDVELRDPFNCFPAPWGVKQQPADIAFVRRVPAEEIVRLYPHAETNVKQFGASRRAPALAVSRSNGTGISPTESAWENPTRDGIAIVEYYDRYGCTMFSPQCEVILSHRDNDLRHNPPFVVFKRFAFNRLQGQFDQAVGLMASIAKVNLLVQIAMEDAVFSETNIYGSGTSADEYLKGRDAVNQFDQGTKVERPTSQIPYQTFQHVDRLVDQLRVTSRYSRQDDGESPAAWATGRGLDALSAGMNAELDELRLVLRYGLQRLDAIRLEWDQARWPTRRKPLVGTHRGATFSEQYTPEKDIGGMYKTRRIYGAMAGFDEPQKIVTGLQLRQSGSMSNLTFMENLRGIEVTREMKRIEMERAAEATQAFLDAKASEGDPAAIMAILEIRDGKDSDQVIRKFFTPQEPEMSPEEQAMLGAGQAGPMVPPQPEDVTTLLTRLQSDGDVQGGLQTVQRMTG